MLTKRSIGLFCLLSLLWLTACRNAQNPFFPVAELSIQLDQPFALTLDQQAKLTEEGLTVTFQKVLEDSRCPSNVQCVEAGQARILIDVTHLDQSPVTFEMNTNPPLKLDVISSEGFQIRLLELNPYPEEIGQHIPAATYEVILVITQTQ
jgi:hypothetical protein